MIRRGRLVGSLVAAMLAAPIGLISAALFRYSPVWGFVALSVVSAAIAGLVLGPAIARARRDGWLAMAAATYVCGVLLYPIVAFGVGGLGLAPGSGPAPPGRSPGAILPAYLFTPVGFLLAAPFVPGVLIGGVLAELAIKHLAPMPAASDAEQARLSRAARWSVGGLVLAAILGLGLLVWFASRPGY